MTARVVVAPDSFKGSIDAAGAASAIAAGWRTVLPEDELVLRPMADGGEGTLDAFAVAVPYAVRVPIPISGTRTSEWLRIRDTAIVELATTCGLLVQRQAPHDADTYGLGLAIRAAIEAGADRLLIGIGGSASTDGGAGALVALGARLLDAAGEPVRAGNRGLHDLARVDTSAMLRPPSGGALILGDVTNPLTGPAGAAAVFGPQKGATPKDIPVLDAGLERLQSTLGLHGDLPGAGAAGGTGAGLVWWGARMRSGGATVADAIGLPTAIAAADLVITGEGRFDAQSAAGKAPDTVRRLAASHGVPVALVAGGVDPGGATGFWAAADLARIAGSQQAAMRDAALALRLAGARLAEQWRRR